MKAKKVLVVLMVCALVVLAFSAAVYAKKGGVDRPFKGTLVGQTWLDVSQMPANLSQTGEGTGNLTHLGLTQMTSVVADVPKPWEEDRAFDGEVILTAANGDQLFLKFTGTSPNIQPGTTEEGDLIVDDSNIEVIEGSSTGRFAGAVVSGHMTAYIVYPGDDQLLEPWQVTWVIHDATISY